MRYDVVVIGSGFGGSVAALRLVEKGYTVAVLEAGRRFADSDLPVTSWRVRRFLWAPALGCYGIQRLDLLRNVLVLSGAGVGGGSLVYANTLYRPPRAFYQDPQWCRITDWERELAPYLDQAERMLGVTRYARTTPADVAMRTVAEHMGVGGTFHPARVGVYFGPPGVDPYFAGAGPRRDPCRHCGACLTGCRYNAKNTLVKNYLYLAERHGAAVHPLTTVTAVRRSRDGYEVHARGTDRRGRLSVFHAGQVIFAAGALGTQRLLHAARNGGDLPRISARLGALTRTNSESIIGARSLRHDADFTDGVAITSSFHPDADTHIEPVRYGPGSNLMGLLQTALTDGGPGRPLRWLRAAARHPVASFPWVRHWSERTVIALVMQSVDNSLTVSLRRTWSGRTRLTSEQGHGAPNPSWIPAGNAAARLLAEAIGGVPGGAWGDIVNVPLTAHILGGTVIGADPGSGVVDAYHRVFGHPGLHVLDGAAVSANLGANPSLAITAQAERALAMWPNKGEPDSRPPLGARYAPVTPVAPDRPAVPPEARAALRLPLPRRASSGDSAASVGPPPSDSAASVGPPAGGPTGKVAETGH